MATLESLPRGDLEARIIQYLTRYYPREFASAGRANARKFVSTGVQRAVDHGFLNIDTATQYVHLMVILGWAFDTDPQLAWAQVKLTDYSLEPADRMRALFGATLEHLTEVAGDNNEKLVRAMIRVRKHDFLAPWNPPADRFDAELLDLLTHLYPAKVEHQGDDANSDLLRHAKQTATHHGFASPNGIAAICCLAFMLGTGFDTDPLYWWAGDTLAASRTLPEPERLARLAQRSLEHIDASLKGQVEGNHGREE